MKYEVGDVVWARSWVRGDPTLYVKATIKSLPLVTDPYLYKVVHHTDPVVSFWQADADMKPLDPLELLSEL